MLSPRLYGILAASALIAGCAASSDLDGGGIRPADSEAAEYQIAAAASTTPAQVTPPTNAEPSDVAALQTAITEYQAIAKAGGWPTVPPGPKLEAGVEGPRVLALTERLIATHDLETAPSEVFDEALATAVKHFQQRHGLAIDAVAGKATLQALNVPVEARLRTMAINLRRLQSERTGWGARYVVVNIAAASYRLVDGGKLVFERPAIVGRPTWPTPRLDGVIERLDFNPYWTVPPRIASAEIFPKIQREPNYLARHHMHYVDGQIRQDPGPDNPLGAVKFFFENPYSVYLHDTNNRGLFARPERFLSHGCIRVAEALDLARYLLKDDADWPPNRIEEVLAAGRYKQVPLKTTIPVHITYYTSWVDDNGIVQFRNDIYSRDRDELAGVGNARLSGDCRA